MSDWSAWAWRAVLAALVPVVVIAELDRASYLRPELSFVVPRPFRSFAQIPTATLALAANDADAAVAEARTLVRRRPMPGEHLFALALAQLQAGRLNEFTATFRAASTRGWRFGPLQAAAAQGAIANGDASGAAKRVAALWAAAGDDPLLPRLTQDLLEMDGGPAALGAAMAGSRVWASAFLSRATEVTSPERALQTFTAAKRAGAQFDCAALEHFRTQMAARATELSPSDFPCP